MIAQIFPKSLLTFRAPLDSVPSGARYSDTRSCCGLHGRKTQGVELLRLTEFGEAKLLERIVVAQRLQQDTREVLRAYCTIRLELELDAGGLKLRHAPVGNLPPPSHVTECRLVERSGDTHSAVAERPRECGGEQHQFRPCRETLPREGGDEMHDQQMRDLRHVENLAEHGAARNGRVGTERRNERGTRKAGLISAAFRFPSKTYVSLGDRTIWAGELRALRGGKERSEQCFSRKVMRGATWCRRSAEVQTKYALKADTPIFPLIRLPLISEMMLPVL